MFQFVWLQVITIGGCLQAESAAESVGGTLMTGVGGLSPTNPSSASLTPSKGRCFMDCHNQDGCRGVMYDDVSSRCVRVTSEHDLVGPGAGVTEFSYYTEKGTCSKATAQSLVHLTSFSCFVVSQVNVSWIAARDACDAAGGRLATLDTQGKMDVVMRELNDKADAYSVSGDSSSAIRDLYFLKPSGMRFFSGKVRPGGGRWAVHHATVPPLTPERPTSSVFNDGDVILVRKFRYRNKQ